MAAAQARPALGLSTRFALLLAAISLALVATVCLLWYQQGRGADAVIRHGSESLHQLAFSSLQRRGQDQVAQSAAALAAPLAAGDRAAIGRILGSVRRQTDVVYVYVFDAEGRIVHDGAGDASVGAPMDDPFAFQAIASPEPVVQWSDEVMDVAGPIRGDGGRLGGLRVGYGLERIAAQQAEAQAALGERLQDLSRRQMHWQVVFVLGAVAATLLLSFLLERWFVRPIRRLADAAREIEAGRFDVPGLLDGRDSRRRDEIGDLTRAFGRMSESVARHDRDIRSMAYSDALTGLPNRLALRELLDARLREQLDDGGQLALLFVDLDDFKRINDTLGHDAGDEVLGELAERLYVCVAEVGGESAALARFGGDEFIALVSGADMRQRAALLAESVIAALQQPFQVLGQQVVLGASVGITLAPQDATGAGVLLKNGDVAMYQAKLAGKHCYRFYSRAMDQAVGRRMQMESDLRGAWERGELSLDYQPIYQLADGHIVGAEALLRWKHPEHGMIPPSVFIDVAEQSGLIDLLGRAVIARACEDAARWVGADDDEEAPFIAVNVSARQLRSGDLPEVVAAALADSGLPPGRLHVELTETTILGDEIQAGALLARLRGTGVRVWLDDFGTGFSGLSHLRRVPVDGVKIDRSFVTDVLRDPDDLALTSAIIAMAHSLGITVVAEGVESEGQHDILRERGCDLAQGFWLARPMSAEAMRQLCRAGLRGYDAEPRLDTGSY
ncbi:putative bifunctional diguanylate cyclase/phosphodiesterase [Coralloluteibacterium stylophorae]|uniref:putative bifunctional diguanylate cyclase/phosphodiesterase n=1 Tax=Coralloluteibacterium stylophorae TaxID=1776034 RepID=UPI00308446DD